MSPFFIPPIIRSSTYRPSQMGSSLTETTRRLQAEPSAFDALRRAYRFPREASAFTVRGARAEERKLLEQLGFVSFS